jgi:paraquat-inducible protein B
MKLVDDEVVLYALIKDEYKNLLAEDSKFWIEDVSVDIDRIENPSAILGGAFVKLLRGRSEKMSDKFYISHNEPVPTANEQGLRVVVRASKLSSLKVGSPVFYRQIQIGSVEAYRLSEDSKNIEMKLFIQECYSYLVRTNSIFYNATAMGMDVSLFGVKVRTETVATMIKGGITMVTPNEPEQKAEELHEFKLYNEPKEEWLNYSPELINDIATCKQGDI